LLRYTGNYFTRRFYFSSKPVRKGMPDARGFHCPQVVDNYEPVAELLDSIREGQSPDGLTEVSQLWDYDPPPDEPANSPNHAAEEVRFWIHTHYDLPEKSSAFALVVKYEGEWERQAFKIGHQQDDFYEMTFEYPCRNYTLEIVPDDGLDIRLANPKATVTFNHNPHGDEQKRLADALAKNPEYGDRIRQKGGLYSELRYPISGAKYRYSWRAVQRHDANHGEKATSAYTSETGNQEVETKQPHIEPPNLNEQ
jgi:hypothetical protein